MRTPLIGLFLVLVAMPVAAQQVGEPEKHLLLSVRLRDAGVADQHVS